MNGPPFAEAFRRLFEERAPGLYRYLAGACRDPAFAEDLVQECFLKLYHRGSMPYDPPAWLVSVARNMIRDHRRGTSRRLTLTASFPDDIPKAAAPESADAAALAEERKAGVHHALDRLPDRDREMLLMRHAGYSYREIAAALGIAPDEISDQ